MRNFSIFTLSIFALSFFHGTNSIAASERKKLLSIDPTSLVLNYEDFDGAFNHPCKASFASPENPYDFKVRCYEGAHLVRTLNVHLIITRYVKPIEPRIQYEILYWVNGEGATSWLGFNEGAKMSHFQSSQSIAGESSALRVRLKL